MIDALGVFAPKEHPRVPPLDVSSLALGGPLASSSLFHLALSICRNALIPTWNNSAPDEKPFVLVIAPKKEDLHLDLVTRPDRWLAEEAGTPAALQMMQNIVFRYCPTSAHLSMLLLSLSASNDKPANAAVLPHAPTAIILHRLSSYFADNDEASCYAYSSLLSQLCDMCRYFDGIRQRFKDAPVAPTKLVLLDPDLFQASLPILPASLRKGKGKKDHRESPERAGSVAPRGETASLATLTEYFVEAIGEVESLDPPLTADEEEEQAWSPRHFKLTYRPSTRRRNRLFEQVRLRFAVSKHTLASGASDRALEDVKVEVLR